MGLGHQHGRHFIVLNTNMASVTSCENTLFKLHGSMAKTPISDLQNARLPSKLSRYPPNVSASPLVPFARDSCWYLPNRKFARGPIGETTHVWVTREIRVLWKAIILKIYMYEHVWFSKSLNITLSLTSNNSREMWFGCDLKTYSRLRSVARATERSLHSCVRHECKLCEKYGELTS